MADNQMKTVITAEDRMSREIERLKAKLDSFRKSFKGIEVPKIDADAVLNTRKVTAAYAQVSRTYKRVTQDAKEWANHQLRAGRLNEDLWLRMERRLESYFDKSGKLRDLEGRHNAGRRRELQQLIRQMSAFEYVVAQQHDKRQGFSRREQDLKDNIARREDRLLQEMEKTREKAHRREVARRREVMRMAAYAAGTPMRVLNRADNPFIGSPLFFGGLAGGAAAKVAQSSLHTRMKADTAETHLQMFGEMNLPEIRAARKEWINSKAIESGMTAAGAMESLAETIKAGVPKAIAKVVTEAMMDATAGMDVNLPQATRVVGRLSTLIGGAAGPDPQKIKSIMGAIGLVAQDTAANPDEIISGMQRGAGVLGASNMKPEQLVAVLGAAVSSGMQGGKAGTFADFLVNNLVGAKNERGQRLKDLASAAGGLGLGGVNGMSRKFANNPAEALVGMLEKMSKMKPDRAAKYADLLGGREWRGELLMLMKALPTLRKALESSGDEDKNRKFLTDSKRIKMASLEGLWSQAVSAFKLFWENVGVGFESMFREVATFFRDLGKSYDMDYVSAHVESFLNGLVDGLGFTNITQMLEAAFGKPGAGPVDVISKVFEFAQGFGEGLRSVFDTVKAMLKEIGLITGVGDIDVKAAGKLVAQLLGFSAAIHIARPAFSLLGGIKDALMGLAAGIVALNAAAMLLGRGSIFAGITAALRGVAGGAGAAAAAGAAGTAGAAGGAGATAAAAARGGLMRVIAGRLLSALAGGLVLGLAAEIGANQAYISSIMVKAVTDLFASLKESITTAVTDAVTSIKSRSSGEWAKIIFEGFLELLDPNLLRFYRRMSGPEGNAVPLVDDQGRPMQDAAPAAPGGGWFGGLFQRQSFNGFDEDMISGLLHRASYQSDDQSYSSIVKAGDYTTLGDVNHSIERLDETFRSMGVTLHRAGLVAPGFGGTGLGGGAGGGLGGGGGAGGGGGRANPSGMVDPGTGAGTGPYKGILDHIARSEGTANRPGGGYNTSLGYGRFLPGGREQNLTGKTLNEILALGDHMRRQPGNPNSSALGRYQIVGNTLRGLMRRLGLSGNEKFDEAMQDRLGAELVRGRGANAQGLAQEWASLRGAKLQEALRLAQGIPRGSSTTPGAREQAGGSPGGSIIDGARVSSNFGWRRHPLTGQMKHHNGIDLAAPAGTEVRAAKDGTVSIDRSGDVTIKHPDGTSTTYRHVNSGVRAGQRVQAGQAIARLRAHDPRSTGPHLHFEERDANGRLVDPTGTVTAARARAIAERARNSADEYRSSGWQPGAGGNAAAIDPNRARAPINVDRVPTPPQRQPAPGRQAAAGGSPVSVVIHAGNQDPHEMASAMERRLTEHWNRRANDLEPELT